MIATEPPCVSMRGFHLGGSWPVAVGMAVTSHPPHRPVLAGTTAYGSYLGSTGRVTTSDGVWERRPRTPHCPWDTLSLFCVRHVLGTIVFSLVTGDRKSVV